MKRQPVQMEATCHRGHMFLPACNLSRCAGNEETIRTWLETHADRAEEEITKIRKENHNSSVIAPFQWNGFMQDGTDLLSTNRLGGYSRRWSSHIQLYNKEQENTELQIHAPVNTALLEEARLAKEQAAASEDGWKPGDEDEQIIDDLDKYDDRID